MTNPHAALPESAEDMEETPYLVYLAIPVVGYDPVDAVENWFNQVALRGLASSDIMALDLEDQSLWVVHPDETYEEYVDEDEGADLDLDLVRPTVDVELPEFVEEKPKKKTKKGKAPVTGPCIRCKEENVLNEDGLCPECVVDMEGLKSS